MDQLRKIFTTRRDFKAPFLSSSPRMRIAIWQWLCCAVLGSTRTATKSGLHRIEPPVARAARNRADIWGIPYVVYVMDGAPYSNTNDMGNRPRGMICRKIQNSKSSWISPMRLSLEQAKYERQWQNSKRRPRVGTRTHRYDNDFTETAEFNKASSFAVALSYSY